MSISRDQSKSLTYDWPRDFSYDSGNLSVNNFYHTDSDTCILKDDKSIFYGKTQWDIFVCAMAIGKKYNLSKPLKKRSNSIPVQNAKPEHIVQILSVAFSEEDTELSILQDPILIRQICEDYANGGVEELIEWRQSYDPENPLSEYEKEFFKLLK